MSNLEAEVDKIYDLYNNLFTHEQFENADKNFLEYDVDEMEETLLYAVLVASLPARSQLPNRETFFELVEERFLDEGIHPEQVAISLGGLR